jgi:hypothetical protein
MTADDIDRFFRFFRQRVQHAQKFCLTGDVNAALEPDLHVLVSAGLDALALYWAKTFRPDLTKRERGISAHRMAEFLLGHGDSRIFAKCSAPNLLARAALEKKTLVPLIDKYLHNEGPPGSVRFWHHDPDHAQVVHDLKGMRDADPKWLRRSRYGELLYREYRCMWLHQFQPSPGLADAYAQDEPEPRYQNKLVVEEADAESMRHSGRVGFKRVQLPMFSRAFMLKTYETVVEAFAKECLASGRTPVVD